MAKKKKEIKAQIKLQVTGAQANPAPPVGPALSQHGVNIGEFVKQFNDKTKESAGIKLPVVVTVYADRSFDFIIKSPPAAVLLKMAAEIAQGSGVPNKEKVGSIDKTKLRQIAETKIEDLNARDIEMAERIIAGTARSMGIEIV